MVHGDYAAIDPRDKRWHQRLVPAYHEKFTAVQAEGPYRDTRMKGQPAQKTIGNCFWNFSLELDEHRKSIS